MKSQRDSKKYSQGYEKLLKLGNEGSVMAQTLIRQYDGGSGHLKGKAKRAYDSAIEWLDECIRFWGRYSNDFGAGSAEERLANSYAACQKLNSAIKNITTSLQGKEEVLDESWREH